MAEHFEIVIVGSGPAGLTAAIYGSRAEHSVLLLEGSQPGGQLTTTTEVENFPGFPKGIMGPQLMNDMREQAKRFGAISKFETVTKVDTSKQPFSVFVNETEYTADALIIATGARSRMLNIENESKYIGRGLSTCATCDGFFYKDKEIVVIGGGDSAMEEANFLSKFANKVTLIHRSEKFRASPIMYERAKNNKKVALLTNKKAVNLLGDDKITGVQLEDTTSGEKEEFKTDGIFLAIGHIPNTELFKDIVETDDLGYVVTQPNSMKTNIAGVFACGDVQDHTYRQAITAAGSGCMAALEAQRFLEEE